MPSVPEENKGLRMQWRRKARSLDLGSRSREDRCKAAAWMWHMHMSTTATNESLAQIRQASNAVWECKRRSSSCDHKDSRFRQEAAANVVSSPPVIKPALGMSVWDCGSKLYDTFELVSVSNRLDQSLIGVPAFEAPSFLHVQSSFHQAGVLRTLSLPRIVSSESVHNSATDHTPAEQSSCLSNGNPSVHESVEPVHATCVSVVQGTTESRPHSAFHPFFAKWFAKLVEKFLASFQGQLWCFKPNIVEREQTNAEPIAIVNGEEGGEQGQLEQGEEQYRMYEEKVKEGHRHFHHHHHHYHHHFLHQWDQSAIRDAEPDHPNNANFSMMSSHSTESAPLSFETMSKICAEENWL